MLLLPYYEIRCDSVERCQGIRVGVTIALCPNNGYYPSPTGTELRMVYVRRRLSGCTKTWWGLCDARAYIAITKKKGLTLGFRI